MQNTTRVIYLSKNESKGFLFLYADDTNKIEIIKYINKGQKIQMYEGRYEQQKFRIVPGPTEFHFFEIS